MMYLSLAVADNGGAIGFVRISLPLSTIDTRLTKLFASMVAGVIDIETCIELGCKK